MLGTVRIRIGARHRRGHWFDEVTVGEGGTEKTARKAKWGMKGTVCQLSDSSLGSVKPAVPLLPRCLL